MTDRNGNKVNVGDCVRLMPEIVEDWARPESFKDNIGKLFVVTYDCLDYNRLDISNGFKSYSISNSKHISLVATPKIMETEPEAKAKAQEVYYLPEDIQYVAIWPSECLPNTRIENADDTVGILLKTMDHAKKNNNLIITVHYSKHRARKFTSSLYIAEFSPVITDMLLKEIKAIRTKAEKSIPADPAFPGSPISASTCPIVCAFSVNTYTGVIGIIADRDNEYVTNSDLTTHLAKHLKSSFNLSAYTMVYIVYTDRIEKVTVREFLLKYGKPEAKIEAKPQKQYEKEDVSAAFDLIKDVTDSMVQGCYVIQGVFNPKPSWLRKAVELIKKYRS